MTPVKQWRSPADRSTRFRCLHPAPLDRIDLVTHPPVGLQPETCTSTTWSNSKNST